MDEQDRNFMATLTVGAHMRLDAGYWERVPDLRQDDVPMTSADVAACRASAMRVRQALRLERIATATFAAMINASPMLSAHVLAETAVDFAKALIAKLDEAK